jgi:Aminoglycoside adenylyltransferase, C-terminal domain
MTGPTHEGDVTAYARAAVAAARAVAGAQLLAVYLHGSAVLGGFVVGHSDVDLLLVIDNPTDTVGATALGHALLSVPGCPGSGLEASAVTRLAAMAPSAPWPFVVHVSSSLGNRKLVLGETDGGDPDLALHFAVVRQSGRTLMGPVPEDLVGQLPRDIILEHMRSELRWGLESAPMAYAVLNAARALRFAAENVLCSKLDGGSWAIAHGEPADIVAVAMNEQRQGLANPISAEQGAWVRSVAARL